MRASAGMAFFGVLWMVRFSAIGVGAALTANGVLLTGCASAGKQPNVDGHEVGPKIETYESNDLSPDDLFSVADAQGQEVHDTAPIDVWQSDRTDATGLTDTDGLQDASEGSDHWMDIDAAWLNDAGHPDFHRDAPSIPDAHQWTEMECHPEDGEVWAMPDDVSILFEFGDLPVDQPAADNEYPEDEPDASSVFDLSLDLHAPTDEIGYESTDETDILILDDMSDDPTAELLDLANVTEPDMSSEVMPTDIAAEESGPGDLLQVEDGPPDSSFTAEICQDSRDNDGDGWADCLDSDCFADAGCAIVMIAAGSFWMGCNETLDSQCMQREFPYHEVWLDEYRIDRLEVNVRQYAECVAAGVCGLPAVEGNCNWGTAGRDDHPINCLRWNQARDYCQWAGKRLCTEAQWEKAARGGCEFFADCATQSLVYPWGQETPTCAEAVMDEGGYGCGSWTTQPVGSKPTGASPYGLLDMAGNVWEWVADWHSATYYEQCQNGCINPQGPNTGYQRLLRGGGFSNPSDRLRTSVRFMFTPDYQYEALGLRCCQ